MTRAAEDVTVASCSFRQGSWNRLLHHACGMRAVLRRIEKTSPRLRGWAGSFRDRTCELVMYRYHPKHWYCAECDIRAESLCVQPQPVSVADALFCDSLAPVKTSPGVQAAACSCC